MMDHFTSPKCPSPWMTLQRGKPISAYVVSLFCSHGKLRPKLDLLTSIEPPTVSKVSPRGRNGSSTSSRLFPGGWFSSPKSPGDGSRASMEEATGEFVLSRSSVAPNEPAVVEAPEDLPASPITPATPTAKKDRRPRACAIM